MFFDKKKERKKKKKTSFRRLESNPGLSFFSRGREVELHNIGATSIIMWVHERRTTINLKDTKGKGIKNELDKQRYVSLEWFSSVKSRPFILESLWQITNILPVVGNSASHYYSWATALWSYDCGVPLFAEGYVETRKSSANCTCYHGYWCIT